MTRTRLACDACGFSVWIGPGPDGVTGWCEACQRAEPVAGGPGTEPAGGGAGAGPGAARRGDPVCPACGTALSIERLRFEELYGELQDLAAVLSAWAGDPAPLTALLPDRPRFLTDLDPPAPVAGDPGPVRLALERLAEGRFGEARQRLEERLEEGGDARLWRAAAVACERLGDLAAAEEACTRSLALAEAPRVRLMRGVLRARRADLDGARADLDRAGETHEARWDRAALAVLAAVARTPGLPAHPVLDAARDAAGAVSDYWSEPTVGRLLWTLLLERARSRGRRNAPECPDERVLRAAESELEFDTFWDRALVVHGYAATGMTRDLARVAAPLAAEQLDAIAAEPPLAHPGAEAVRAAVAVARGAIATADAAAARDAIRGLLERDDLRRYRVPCGACGRGTLGVEALEEDAADPA